MTTTTNPTTVTFASLPAIGSEIHGGTFAGITTTKDGQHQAVVLLPETAKKLTWKKAMNWAAKQDAELPSRPVAALLFANVKDKLTPSWHWTNEQYDASFAWSCDFNNGNQTSTSKSFEGSAVAVRLIPVTA